MWAFPADYGTGMGGNGSARVLRSARPPSLTSRTAPGFKETRPAEPQIGGETTGRKQEVMTNSNGQNGLCPVSDPRAEGRDTKEIQPLGSDTLQSPADVTKGNATSHSQVGDSQYGLRWPL